MKDLPPSLKPDMPPDPQEMLDRSRRLWRICLVLPFVYVGVAYVVSRFAFHSHPNGFWPMQVRTYRLMLTGFAATVVVVECFLVLIRLYYRQLMEKAQETPQRIGELYLKRTLLLSVLSDIASVLGLVAFLTNADWQALMIFCSLAYLLYIQAYPRGRFLGDR